MNDKTVILEKKDYIAKVTLNRPDRLNAVNGQLCEEFLVALDEIGKDDDVRVIVLTGAGRAFCSGADVRGMEGGPEATSIRGGVSEMGRQVLGSTMVRRIRLMRKPSIAMVNGPAVGGGCALALACDIRMGSENARFMNAFVKRGLGSGWAGPWLYPRVMGLGKALEILLTGDFLEAEEAEKVGVLNHLVPADKLEEETMKLARKIACGPPIAIRETRRQVYAGLSSDFETGLQASDVGERITVVTEDHIEGVKAFVEKREPRFKGR